MNALPLLLLLTAATAAPNRIIVIDTVHSRLSGIVHTTLTEELRSRGLDTSAGDRGAEYVAEIVSMSDAGGKGRTSQIDASITRRVQVTEVTGGAAAEVHLIRASTGEVVATWKLTGSGSTSAAVGGSGSGLFNQIVVGPLFRRSRSAEGARAIAHDIAAQIAAQINSPAPDTRQR